jgi:Protein of unknown function (DUF5132)
LSHNENEPAASHHQNETASAAGSGNGNSPAERTARVATRSRKSAYLWGAASGVALALFAPVLRPAARTAVKSGMRVGRYAKKLASNVKEEFEDIATEAQADLEREDRARHDKDIEE